MYVKEEAERMALEASKKVAAAVKGGKPLKDALAAYLAEAKDQVVAPAAAKDDKKDKKADEKKGDAEKGGEKADEKKDDRAPLTIDNHPNRPTLETSLPFSVNGDPIPGVQDASSVTKPAFALEKPGEGPANPIPFDDGYVAIALKDKTPATKEAWEKDRAGYMANMRANKANDALVAYVRRLRSTLAPDAQYTAAFVDEPKGRPGQGSSGPDDDGE